MKVNKFYYVYKLRGRVKHMSKHITEGYRTYCDKELFIGAEWRVALRLPLIKDRPVCKHCLAELGN